MQRKGLLVDEDVWDSAVELGEELSLSAAAVLRLWMRLGLKNDPMWHNFSTKKVEKNTKNTTDAYIPSPEEVKIMEETNRWWAEERARHE